MPSSTISSSNEPSQQSEASQQETKSRIPAYIAVAAASVAFTAELYRFGVVVHPNALAAALGYAAGNTLVPGLMAYLYHKKPTRTRFWIAIVVGFFFIFAGPQPY